MKYHVNLLKDHSISPPEGLSRLFDFSEIDDAGVTPLIAAIQMDYLQISKIFMDNGADPRQTTFLGSPIGAAIASDKPNANLILGLLLEAVGPFSQQENPMAYCGELNEPMLHAAIRRKNLDAVKLLLDYKYSPYWADTEGISALDLAESIDPDVYSVLRSRATVSG